MRRQIPGGFIRRKSGRPSVKETLDLPSHRPPHSPAFSEKNGLRDAKSSQRSFPST